MKNVSLSINGVKQKKMHCGPACLEMTLRFFGCKDASQDEIGKELNVKGRRGCYPSDVIRYLGRYNIVAEKTKHLNEMEKIVEGNPIFLGQRDHFMLLVGYEDGKYIYIDPQTARKNKDAFEVLKRDVVDLIVIKKVGDINASQGKTKSN